RQGRFSVLDRVAGTIARRRRGRPPSPSGATRRSTLDAPIGAAMFKSVWTSLYSACGRFRAKETCRMNASSLVLVAAAALARTTCQFPTTLAWEQPATVKDEPAPRVPDAIAVPAGDKLLFGLDAKGVQIYRATLTQAGALEWTLEAPLAELTVRGEARAV